MKRALAFVVALASTNAAAQPATRDGGADPAAPGTEGKPEEAGAAPAATPEPGKGKAVEVAAGTSSFDLRRVSVSGYLLPLLVYSQRDNAVARDRLRVGVLSSRIGLVFMGTPVDHWTYRIELGFDAAVISNRDGAGPKVVNEVSLLESGNGSSMVRTSSSFLTGVYVEEATVRYQPIEWYTLKVGHMRMPFSVAQAATITTTMFPNRPGPTAVFQSGPDDGVLNVVELFDGRFHGGVGAFNGSSLGLQLPNTTTLGPVYATFLDVHPLGKMPPREGGAVRGALRVGLGIGMLYRIGTLFDDTGYEASRFSDARFSAAVRAAFGGLFIQGEYLRRVQTDSLSLRPAIATGTYAQASFYQPLGPIALSPLGRVGLSTQDESFAPQRTLSYEGGIAFYPRSDLPEPDALRVLVQYLGERRTPSEETANGALVQLQFKW